jgi:regulator of nucleoside diphosphate kinase
MKHTELHPVLMIEDDYRALKRYAGDTYNKDVMSLARELDRAIIVHRDAFPDHAIRLNSEVSLVEKKTKKKLRFTIVLPGQASIAEQKISALAPVAVAVIGFRKGEEISCELPGGTKQFIIEEVVNRPAA